MSAAVASAVTVIPDAASAAATVPRPTPSRPRTATHKGAAMRRMIGVNRGLWCCSANRASASTKIWWPSIYPTRAKPGSHGACWHLHGHIANGCPQYQSKATVGYLFDPRLHSSNRVYQLKQSISYGFNVSTSPQCYDSAGESACRQHLRRRPRPGRSAALVGAPAARREQVAGHSAVVPGRCQGLPPLVRQG